LRLLLLVILSVITIALDYRIDFFKPVRNLLSAVVAPVQYVVDTPIKWSMALDATLSNHQTLLVENTRLRTQNLLLQARLQRLIALENENSQLRSLLSSAQQTGNEKMIVAQMLAVNTEPLSSEIVLDKGKHNGVYEGQPVLDARGIMGQVTQVGPLTSRVLLLTDLRSAIPVQDTRNGIRGIVVGRGNLAKLALTDIPVTVDVKVGDTLVSSGLDGHYPSGHPVGVISHIRADPNEQFTAIEITPSAQLDRNQFVLLIWPPKIPTIDAPKLIQTVNTPKKINKK
jgi:rod shape-determining protein MreC